MCTPYVKYICILLKVNMTNYGTDYFINVANW